MSRYAHKHPLLIDRGPNNPWRFLCATNERSRTSFVSQTAEGAYNHWATNTRPGAFHRNIFGFQKVQIIERHT